MSLARRRHALVQAEQRLLHQEQALHGALHSAYRRLRRTLRNRRKFRRLLLLTALGGALAERLRGRAKAAVAMPTSMPMEPQVTRRSGWRWMFPAMNLLIALIELSQPRRSQREQS